MDLFKSYTLRAYGTRILILCIDCFLVTSSIFISTILRFNFDLDQSIDVFTRIILPLLGARLICFRIFKTYSVIIRFAGFKDVLKVFFSVSSGSLIIIISSLILINLGFKQSLAGMLWFHYGFIFPISILIIDYFITLIFLGGFRILMPSLFGLFFYNRMLQTNLIIIGAGQLGSSTLKHLGRDPNKKFNIVAIIDDNPDINLKSLDGITIYNPDAIEALIEKYKIDKAILAIRNISLERKNFIVDSFLKKGVGVLKAPVAQDWENEKLNFKLIKEIRIEDLLNRAEINTLNDIIGKELKNRIVLITGAAGSIGSELVRQSCIYNPKTLIIVDQAETPLVDLWLETKEKINSGLLIPEVADVSDFVRISSIFEKYKPDIVIHAAAYKHVPIMEYCPREAVRVNINGTRNVANCAHALNINKFVLVSTDKAVNPTNVMGASKRIAELYIQSLSRESNTKFITTRFGNVLGSNGSVIPRFRKQIENGGPVTVTHREVTRYFMTIPEAVNLILEAGTMGQGGEIFLFDMGKPIKIIDLAHKMIKLSGLVPNVDIDIEIIGLRPGEKLYEELLATEENSLKTYNSKIMKAKTRYYDYKIIDNEIHQLIGAMDIMGNKELVALINKIVPEFNSTNTDYMPNVELR